MSRDIGRTAGMIGFGLAGAWGAGLLGVGGLAGQMLVGLGYMGGSFIGSLIFPLDDENRMPPMSKYPIQNSTKGLSVPICYGTARVAGNVIWMGDVQTYSVEAEGGKGIGGDAPEQTMYRRSFCIALCEGQRYVMRAWEGKHEITIGTSYSYGGETFQGGGGKGATIFSGAEQEVTVFTGDGMNLGLADLIGEDFAHYKHLCCVFFENWDLGAVDMLPNFTFEVTQALPRGLLVSSGASGLFRCDAANEFIQHMDESQFGHSCDYDPNTGRYVISASRLLDGGLAYIYENDGTLVDVNWQYGSWWDYIDETFSVRFSFDGTKLFILTRDPEWILKYDLATGALDAEYDLQSDSHIDPYYMDIDLFDNIYVAGRDGTQYGQASGYCLTRFNSDLVKTAIWKNVHGIRDTKVVQRGGYLDALTGELIPTGKVFQCGTSGGVQGWICDLEVGYDGIALSQSTQKIDVKIPGAVVGKSGWFVEYIDGYWYLYTDVIEGNRLHKIKFNPDLDGDGNAVIELSKPRPSSITGMYHWCKGPDHLLYGQGTTALIGAAIFVFDTDLNLLATYNAENDEFSGAFISPWGSECVYFHDASEGGDANPAEIMYDLCINKRYGAGIPNEYIDYDSVDTCFKYYEDNDLLISPELTAARSLLDWLQYICAHCGGFLYWMGGKLYQGAWRGETPEVHITQADLVSDGDNPPIQVIKRKYSESRNHIEVAWLNRDDIYGPAVTPAHDDVDIRYSGKVRKQQIELGGIKRPVLAQKMAYRYLIDSMYRFSTYTFTLGFKKSLLHVGQVCLLSDGFKIDSQRIRIISVSESKDGANLQIEAVDDISDLYPDITWTSEVTHREAETPVTAADLGEPIVTTREDWHERKIYVSIAPTTAYCTGWHIYVSRDGITYAHMETVSISGVTGGSANSAGTLLTSLPPAQAVCWRGDEGVTVDIGTVTDLHTDITDAQFFGNLRLAKIGDEVVAYKECTELGTEGQWRIKGLIRGLFQTEPVAHAIGETFRALDVNYVGEYSLSDIGQTLYIKAVTIYGALAKSISDANATQVTVVGNPERPYGASAVRLTSDECDGGFRDYSGASFSLYWNLGSKTSGFNVGGQDGGGNWQYGDDESELIAQGGVAYGSYLQDAELQGVDLIFREEDGTYIGESHLGILETATVTKATDLDGNNPARIDVLPRYGMRATRIESALVDDGS